MTLGPVPAAVGVTTDETGNTWVFAGSGRYYTQTGGTGDKIDASTQYLVGIKDSVLQGSGGCSRCHDHGLSSEFHAQQPADRYVDGDHLPIGIRNLHWDGRQSASDERAGNGRRRNLCVASLACAK